MTYNHCPYKRSHFLTREPFLLNLMQKKGACQPAMFSSLYIKKKEAREQLETLVNRYCTSGREKNHSYFQTTKAAYLILTLIKNIVIKNV